MTLEISGSLEPATTRVQKRFLSQRAPLLLLPCLLDDPTPLPTFLSHSVPINSRRQIQLPDILRCNITPSSLGPCLGLVAGNSAKSIYFGKQEGSIRAMWPTQGRRWFLKRSVTSAPRPKRAARLLLLSRFAH